MHPPAFTFLLAGLFLSFSAAALHAQPAKKGEVQSHGLVFEEWVRDHFFNYYRPAAYTQKWDIPAEANRDHGGIPVNPKAAQFGSPVGLGDALRQFEIDEPFLLIIGYWREEGENKRFVKAIVSRIEPALWRKLWHPITRADLLKLDGIVKDRSLDYREARRLAQELKSAPPFTLAAITLNPKIDGKNQRRLQCSLSYSKVLSFLAPPGTSAKEETQPTLFGQPLPGPFHSPRRQFPNPAP